MALGVSWPCHIVDNLTLGVTYAKGIDEAPDNFNLIASYDLKVAIVDAEYNHYDALGKAATIGVSKSFQMTGYAINTALRYTSFSSDSPFIEDQDHLYLTAELTF